MKKALIAILALVGMTQVSYADAYYTKQIDSADCEVNLIDVAATFSSDTFAISFELDRSLTDIYSSGAFVTFILGGSSSYRVAIVSMGNTMTMSAGNSSIYTFEVPCTSGPFVLQVEDGGVATLLSNNYGSLETIMRVDNPVYDIPDVIDMSTITFTGVTASNITTWTGVVTAEDLANPTPAPTPAVPEPTTATLFLLALAGLAARRRRK